MRLHDPFSLDYCLFLCYKLKKKFTEIDSRVLHLSGSFRKIRTTMGTSRILLNEDQFNLTSSSA